MRLARWTYSRVLPWRSTPMVAMRLPAVRSMWWGPCRTGLLECLGGLVVNTVAPRIRGVISSNFALGLTSRATPLLFPEEFAVKMISLQKLKMQMDPKSVLEKLSRGLIRPTRGPAGGCGRLSAASPSPGIERPRSCSHSGTRTLCLGPIPSAMRRH